ncbi:hypothetical protein GPECTOR_2047g1054 [Gonium pectorale]|uniref:Uncharacterized protein n=1 Tax=Gonium pectorale TaxID=33097 RepID=A0A150FT87_GONPE|nr:hypothetical protein GPECTOR_2047g1054 [Gonium pectorale]|eukprot:KXZ40833.1 hypothetical protein GPECTOR_2047g1054 [Gonium pectorale]
MAEVMLRRLQRLPWRRIDVSFRGATFGFAHSNIQVTRRWMNFEGMAVATHVAQQVAALEAEWRRREGAATVATGARGRDGEDGVATANGAGEERQAQVQVQGTSSPDGVRATAVSSAAPPLVAAGSARPPHSQAGEWRTQGPLVSGSGEEALRGAEAAEVETESVAGRG